MYTTLDEPCSCAWWDVHGMVHGAWHEHIKRLHYGGMLGKYRAVPGINLFIIVILIIVGLSNHIANIMIGSRDFEYR